MILKRDQGGVFIHRVQVRGKKGWFVRVPGWGTKACLFLDEAFGGVAGAKVQARTFAKGIVPRGGGVYLKRGTKEGNTWSAWCGWYKPAKKKLMTVSFGVKKYGELKAFSLACAWVYWCKQEHHADQAKSLGGSEGDSLLLEGSGDSTSGE